MSRREELLVACPDDDLPGEVRELLAELENDRGVQLALEVPVSRHKVVRQVIQVDTRKEKAMLPEARRVNSSQNVGPSIVYRDSSDVRTILSLTFSMMIMAVLLVASGVGNVYQYLRRPDRIVVDGGSGRVLSINDRNYGREENVEFGPDRLTNEDKLYATKQFVRFLYQVDPSTRSKDLEKALTMMVPASAVTFARWMRERGVVDQQRAESWQAVWTPMDVSVDRSDPYTVSVIGKQEITKVVGGAAQTETKQLRLTVKLVADPKGRADRNLRTGFLVAVLDTHELPGSAAPAGTSTSPESKVGQGPGASTNLQQ